MDAKSIWQHFGWISVWESIWALQCLVCTTLITHHVGSGLQAISYEGGRCLRMFPLDMSLNVSDAVGGAGVHGIQGHVHPHQCPFDQYILDWAFYTPERHHWVIQQIQFYCPIYLIGCCSVEMAIWVETRECNNPRVQPWPASVRQSVVGSIWRHLDINGVIIKSDFMCAPWRTWHQKCMSWISQRRRH